MKIQVNSKFLSNLFGEFVKNNKLLFNFRTNGNILDIQVLDDYTVCASVPVTCIDGDKEYTDASFWVTKAIGIMDREEPLTITFHDAVVIMEQSSFNCTFVKEYEGRRDFPDMSNSELKPAFANRLKYISHSMISCSPLAKELSIYDPDPVFSHGKFYANYRETFFIESIDYPEMCIAYEIFRNFSFRLDEKARYAYISELNVLYIHSGVYHIWVPTVNYNIDGSTITAIDRKLSECIKVTDICFKDYSDRMSIMSSAFPKQRFTLFIGGNCFSLSISTNDTSCHIGNLKTESLLGISITSAQVAVIAKIFKEDDSVECLRGGNCICLRSGEKNILIAGMIY